MREGTHMLLKDLEGKKVIRTKRLEGIHEHYDYARGLVLQKFFDRSYLCEEFKVLKVTKQLAYLQKITDRYGSKVDAKVTLFPLQEYDDGGWEESLLGTFYL